MSLKTKRFLHFLLFFTAISIIFTFLVSRMSKNLNIYTTPSELFLSQNDIKAKSSDLSIGGQIEQITDCEFVKSSHVCKVISLQDQEKTRINIVFTSIINPLIKQKKYAIFKTKMICDNTKKAAIQQILDIYSANFDEKIETINNFNLDAGLQSNTGLKNTKNAKHKNRPTHQTLNDLVYRFNNKYKYCVFASNQALFKHDENYKIKK